MSENENNTSADSPSEQAAHQPLELTNESAQPVSTVPPQAATEPQPSKPNEFPPLTLDLALSPTSHARIQVTGVEGRGWTLQDFARLIAFLELQRSFLADEPLNVSVAVTSPQASRK